MVAPLPVSLASFVGSVEVGIDRLAKLLCHPVVTALQVFIERLVEPWSDPTLHTCNACWCLLLLFGQPKLSFGPGFRFGVQHASACNGLGGVHLWTERTAHTRDVDSWCA